MNTITNYTRNKGRVVVVNLQPEIDGGRYPIKRSIGDLIHVTATVVADGHDEVTCLLRVRSDDGKPREFPMERGLNDIWSAEFRAEFLGLTSYTVEGWIDRFATWRKDFKKRITAQQDVKLELHMGAELVQQASMRATGSESRVLSRYAELLSNRALPSDERIHLAVSADLFALMKAYPDRSAATLYDKELYVVIDRPRARFGAWYELFPRSYPAASHQHGTFQSCEAILPKISQMGFDVVYLPPIHPIGMSHRKGPNNTVVANSDDVGSPWAIGNNTGGHTAVHPQLGTLEDFRHFVSEAKKLNLEVALDIAFQCSPDHPYVQTHPEWFRRRPDGSIQFAENPPKKYEDIYPFDFETAEWEPLWNELRSVVQFWIDQGVRIFRVDNPHTKPLTFWEWLIGTLRQKYPDLIFLSEAFTRPTLMYQLAKVGFSQSYNYFPWKNTKAELETYFTELVKTEVREYFRYNLWPNTPDILTDYLQQNGRAGFVIRFILAATLGANYGVYGPAFELCEHQARSEGSEEYFQSEKYEIKQWDLNRPGHLRALMARMNGLRRAHAALQWDETLMFHPSTNDQLICYSKRSLDKKDIVIIVVNIDAKQQQAGEITLPLQEFGINEQAPFQVRDGLTGISYIWHGPRQFIELDPTISPAHLFVVEAQ